MQFTKRLVCICVCLVLLVCMPLNVLAEEPARKKVNRNSFVFESDPSRMTAKGKFHFSVENYMRSSYFDANSDTIKLTISAWMRDTTEHSEYYDPIFSAPTDSNQEIEVALYRLEGHTGIWIDTIYVAATDTTTTYTYKSIQQGSRYYLTFTCRSQVPDNMIIDGKGRVTDVTVPYPS